MGNMVREESAKIISHYIQEFTLAIDKAISIDNKTIHPVKSDFPIFRLANDAFFEYLYYEQYLEWKTRDYLITGIFQSFFSNEIISPQTIVHPINNKGNNIFRSSFSKIDFGDEYPFAFILEKGSEQIGIRYSDICVDERHLKRILSYYKISHIDVIDWTDTNAVESRITSCYRNDSKNRVRFLTLRQFFLIYFSDEIYELYLSEVRKAIAYVNSKIGFQTIPSLSLRYVSNFKTICLKSIEENRISNNDYYCFDDNGFVTSSKSNRVPKADCEIMDKKFYSGKLYTVLVGDEDFAQCFLTAEYLYNVFKKGENIGFDYTSVVAGYLKSVELLLYRISNIWLNDNMHQELWIAGGKPAFANNPQKEWCRWNPENTGKPQVKFSKKYEKYFSTEMGALIWLLHDNPNGWNISEEGRLAIHNNLLNYKQGCRNDYLHKDIVNNLQTVEYIRNNTLLCLYYLLGGCIISGDSQDDKQILGLGDTSYERLYKKFRDMPSATRCFIIQETENDKRVMAMKLFDQSPTEYDDLGKIITPLRFVLINDYSEIVFSTNEEYQEIVRLHKQFEINRNTVPYKVWSYSPNSGEIQITW